jgi:hypothetical protein
MVCIPKQRLKRALNNEVSKSQKTIYRHPAFLISAASSMVVSATVSTKLNSFSQRQVLPNTNGINKSYFLTSRNCFSPRRMTLYYNKYTRAAQNTPACRGLITLSNITRTSIRTSNAEVGWLALQLCITMVPSLNEVLMAGFPRCIFLVSPCIKMRVFCDIAPWSSPWWWTQYARLKRRSTPARLQSAISQNTLIFILDTSNLTHHALITIGGTLS